MESAIRHSNSVNELLFKIKLLESKHKHIKNGLFSSEKHYWKLAHRQAREVVQSIAIRFITGGRYSDIKWIHVWEQQ